MRHHCLYVLVDETNSILSKSAATTSKQQESGYFLFHHYYCLDCSLCCSLLPTRTVKVHKHRRGWMLIVTSDTVLHTFLQFS